MSRRKIVPGETAFLLCDLQNDFLHPKGAYGRAGLSTPSLAALPEKLRPLKQRFVERGGVTVLTQFTLVAGRDGEPMIAPHLKQLRPFLANGDFSPGAWGHDIVEPLGPVDFKIEKVAFSAFYMSRLEWVLRKLGIRQLLVAGLVTNGGVASTVRDAHVRDFETVLLSDGCAAFSDEVHETALRALTPVCSQATIAEIFDEINV